MQVLIYTPIVLSLLAMGAHFLRFANIFGVIGILVTIGLLFLRRAWVARVIQVVLVVGAFEWVLTLISLARMRAAVGEPATRMVIILAAVAVVTAGSALLFETQTLKKVYGLDKQGPRAD